MRSCGYIELFVLSKEDVMSSITDYPEAQIILAKHGRKRLALELVDSPGLRDETTSGSPSESDEIEVRVTGPDSPISNSFYKSCLEVPCNTPCNGRSAQNNHLAVDNTDADDSNSTPRMYLETSKHMNTHRILNTTISTMSTQSNVIGPASQMKLVDSRQFLRMDKLKSNKEDYSTDEEEHRSTGDLLLKTRRSLKRSFTDIRRRRKALTHKKCTLSDNGMINSPTVKKFIESTIINQHFEDASRFAPATEGEFLKSMKEIYMKVISNIPNVS